MAPVADARADEVAPLQPSGVTKEAAAFPVAEAEAVAAVDAVAFPGP